MQTETINGLVYDFYYLKGTIVGKEKTSKTELSSGGGGGYNFQGTGYSSTAPIISVTTVKDSIFIREDNGQEHQVSLINWDIACREGHQMVFVWATPKGARNGKYLAVKNLTINKFLWDNAEFKRMSKHSFGKLAALIVIPAVLLSYNGCQNPFGNTPQKAMGIIAAVFFGLLGLMFAFGLSNRLYKNEEYKKIGIVVTNIIKSI